MDFLKSVAASIVGGIITWYCQVLITRWRRRHRSLGVVGLKDAVGSLWPIVGVVIVWWMISSFSCYVAFLHPREYRVEPGPARLVSVTFLICAILLSAALWQVLLMTRNPSDSLDGENYGA